MSTMLQQIKGYMSAVETGPDGAVQAQFVFPAKFIGFRGHFPGQPVLPGVCLVQAALVLLQTWAGRPLTLRTLVATKFFQPVTPGLALFFAGRATSAPDSVATLDARITCAGKKVAAVTLQAASQEAPR